MDVLILGGTRFLGSHVTDALLQRGHAVTQFNRGVTQAAVRDVVVVVHGDRATDLERLPSKNWDAVIDTCGYTPSIVATSARALHRAHRYVFISSVSVYDTSLQTPEDEELPLAVLPEASDTTTVTPETYGALKALCEREVQAVFGDRTSIVRPGLIAGSLDPTDRFTYWPVRVEAGGEFVAPEDASVPLQYVDVRDVADFVITLIERGTGGTFNAVTSPESRTFGALIDACRAATKIAAEPVWTSANVLEQHDVAPWSDLPLWIPRSDPSARLLSTSNESAIRAGLAIRPIAETVRDTLAWARSTGKRFGNLATGLTPEREAKLLASLAR